MSSMLEQAVIDAEALREVAIKNAESAVIEKYSEEIKGALEQLLEQDELAPDPIIDDMPLAATEGEPACPCPEEDTVFRVDFNELSKQAEAESYPEETHLDAAEDVMGDPGEEELTGLAEAVEEELNIDELNLENILEELTVETEPTKSGWAGTPDSTVKTQEEQALAMEQDDAVKEENEALRSAVASLEENKANLEAKLVSESKKGSKLEMAVSKLANTLNKTNLINAKLLYTNKALTSTSLNERQKTNLAEALSKAETVEEAKVIFETLQSTVGHTPKEKPSESLSEAVNRTSSTMLLSRSTSREEKDAGQGSDRWKILAGIK
tara:strand:+ start:9894 stop:10868 length:975 start_codon:yes stop_codon:yes gene_type:complete